MSQSLGNQCISPTGDGSPCSQTMETFFHRAAPGPGQSYRESKTTQDSLSAGDDDSGDTNYCGDILVVVFLAF